MTLGNELLYIWLAAALSALGVTGMVTCRLGERSRRRWLQHSARWLFCVVFAMVAAGTLLLLAAQHGHWILSGSTMMAMVVGATLDCGGWSQRREF